MCAKNKIYNVFDKKTQKFIRTLFWDDDHVKALQVAATLLNRREDELLVGNTGKVQEKCGSCGGGNK